MILEARRASGLTQESLARRSGVTRSAISMYETGAREPGAEVFLHLLTAAGAAVSGGQPAPGLDCYRNSEVFASLASILPGVPIEEAGPLRFPSSAWQGSDP